MAYEAEEAMIRSIKQDAATSVICEFIKDVNAGDALEFPEFHTMRCDFCKLQVACEYYYAWDDHESYTWICKKCREEYLLIKKVFDVFDLSSMGKKVLAQGRSDHE